MSKRGRKVSAFLCVDFGLRGERLEQGCSCSWHCGWSGWNEYERQKLHGTISAAPGRLGIEPSCVTDEGALESAKCNGREGTPRPLMFSHLLRVYAGIYWYTVTSKVMARCEVRT